MFRSWEIDFDARAVRLEFLDGRVVQESLTRAVPESFSVRRSRMDLERRVMLLTLDDGQTLEVDIGVAGQGVPADVPIVYLDQLHWISLARQQWAPDRLRDSQRAAATTLIALADQQEILLPVAGAHLTEMASIAGRRRRDLAATILGLCRGWQMQNPVRIRGQEYLASMLGQEPVAAGVFTLEPGVLFAEGPATPAPMPGAPPGLAEMFSRVIAISAVYSAMLDDEPVDMGEGKAAAERWATSFPKLASYMREQRMSEEHARINGRARLIADQSQDLERAGDRAGVTPEQFARWLSDRFPEDLARMPYVGRLNEVLYLRLRNADDKWEANDLNDMNFLCAAAGYADITIGEKKTINYLRRAEAHVRPGSQLCGRLSEAVEMLAASGAIP
ncbi:MAG: hypothetical protein AABM42_10590 [Actinomycetota bacterium]